MPRPAPDPWSRVASLYRWQEPLEARSLDRLTGLLDIRPGQLVVDVGAGPGTLTRRLRAAAPEALVLGVERSARMVRAGRRHAASTVRGDAARLPLATGSVDVVAAGFLLHVLTRPLRGAAVREAARVLRPGGLLGVVVPAPPPGPGPRLVRRLTTTVLRAGGRTGVLSVPADLDDLLAATGFRVVADVTTGAGYWSRVLVARLG